MEKKVVRISDVSVRALVLSTAALLSACGGSATEDPSDQQTRTAPRGPATGPAASAEEQITQLYQELLFRDPDPAGLQYWSQRLASRLSTLEQISDAIKHDEEYILLHGHDMTSGIPKTDDEIYVSADVTENGDASVMFAATNENADFHLEAEAANRVLSPFRVFQNVTASGGKVVAKPKGTAGRGVLTFKLNLASAGDYNLSARVYAPNQDSNSVLVRLNKEASVLWTFSPTDAWQVVQYPKPLHFQSGIQILQIYSDKADTGIDRLEIVKSSPAAEAGLTRGLWVWTTSQIIATSSSMDDFIQMCAQSQVTDVYLYIVKNDYTSKAASLKKLNALLRANGIRAWGLEGYRGFFSDADGPQGLYDVVNALIAFNASAAANEKFYGFQSDLEPQDGQGNEFRTTFHSEIPTSKLSQTGGGVWYRSQAEDREMLMRDWLQIHAKLKTMTVSNGLKLGAAMPSWTDDYYGEEVPVTFNNVRQGVMKHMMAILDEYAIMSYNIDPNNVVNRVKGELQYAETLPADHRPRVFAGLETHKGVGGNVSYGDSATKNSRTAVLNDIETIKVPLKNYTSFRGVNIHAWVGWISLKP